MKPEKNVQHTKPKKIVIGRHLKRKGRQKRKSLSLNIQNLREKADTRNRQLVLLAVDMMDIIKCVLIVKKKQEIMRGEIYT